MSRGRLLKANEDLAKADGDCNFFLFRASFDKILLVWINATVHVS